MNKKKYIVPLIATGTFIVGLICMFLPFLPFGWFLMFMTALLLTPYFKPVKKLLVWMIRRDKTGICDKARKKVSQLYRFAGDRKRARDVENLHKAIQKGEV